MSEFKKVEHASFSPTQCALCGAHEGPFIDTHFDVPVYGHVYICASTGRRSGCVRQMARLDGMVEEKHLGEIVAREQALHDEIADLRNEMESSRIVNATQFVDFMSERGLVISTGPQTGTHAQATVTLKQTRKPKEE